MSITRTYSAQLIGLDVQIVTIEIDISNGLHTFSIVGLGDRSIDEAKDRISAAIKHSGYTSPKQKNQKVIISLAPADTRKEGPSFDLAMALSYLIATGDIEIDPERILFLGELSLDGTVRRVSGILPILCRASVHGFTTAFVPTENSREASLAQGITVYAVSSLTEIIKHCMYTHRLNPIDHTQSIKENADTDIDIDFADIQGSESAKRGLEIAVAGAHHAMLSGPPGTGKTMLAQATGSIVPPLSYEHAIEVTSIYSLAHVLDDLMSIAPFRKPHHTASYPAIIGGGSFPKPGEITLAHRGILYLDEMPEFDREVLEALRQPLEERSITISRARGTVTFPAQCMLIGSMNPCPCGRGRGSGCICSERSVRNYQQRISKPIIDRIDIWMHVTKIDYDALSARKTHNEPSSRIKQRVIEARDIQARRFKKHSRQIVFNSDMNVSDLEQYTKMHDEARTLLRVSAERMNLSGRAFHRVIKVAQTIADLAKAEVITKDFILEALQYRYKNS